MANFRCPSRAEVLQSVIALLPRGRAWQTHETGPQAGYGVGFHPGGYNPDGFETEATPRSVLHQFWSSIAGVFTYMGERLCQLRLEFWCATHSETHDWWLTEYGLPDACGPFPDLCTKVAAIGGTTCDYYAFVAARAGWSLSCVAFKNDCGARAGCALTGRARPGRQRAGYLNIVVDLKNSWAFSGDAHLRPYAGRMKAGRRLSCGPDISALECILARIVHAEIEISYEAIA